ncbi:MAG: hypothetical protein QOK37_448 [Thermoanaerobaculia bacterium]|jgi:hypothetical protein|nr:hypothetical protein [Thermoanaerobaculia bacterium]
MTYSPLLIIHIGAGMIAVLAGFAALFVRKGSLMHRRTGDVFVISMLLMAGGGATIALMKSQPMNVMAGLFTFYLVATAWLTVWRKSNQTGSMEVGLLVLGLAVCAIALYFGLRDAHAAHRASAIAAAVFGSATLLSVLGDVRMLVRGGVSGVQRLVRHLWRMCVALFIATGSFFLGTAGDPVMRKSGLRASLFTPAIRATHIPEVPVLLVVLMMIFWLIWVRVSKRYKRTAASPVDFIAETDPLMRTASPARR